jgi:hypothetical protein
MGKEEGHTSVHSLAAWQLVYRPKCRGGLGVINFEMQNSALLLKHFPLFCLC